MGKLIKDTAFVIPVYNEEQVIADVVKDLAIDYKYIICVNDGSSDNSAEVISTTEAYLVNHPINMGQGAALQTGIEFALSIKEVQYIVTFDADGQHLKSDAHKMISELRKDTSLDVVLGSRFIGKTVNMSVAKKRILKLAVLFTNLSTGLRLTDTHNGLRVMTRSAAAQIEITLSDMAHASEILSLIKQHQLSYKEVPVTIRYTDYSTAKGQSIFNSVNILVDLIMRQKK